MAINISPRYNLVAIWNVSTCNTRYKPLMYYILLSGVEGNEY